MGVVSLMNEVALYHGGLLDNCYSTPQPISFASKAGNHEPGLWVLAGHTKKRSTGFFIIYALRSLNFLLLPILQ